jgi:hypothetical protein
MVLGTICRWEVRDGQARDAEGEIPLVAAVAGRRSLQADGRALPAAEPRRPPDRRGAPRGVPGPLQHPASSSDELSSSSLSQEFGAALLAKPPPPGSDVKMDAETAAHPVINLEELKFDDRAF